MIQPITLSATHMECRNLQDSFAVMTELLAFEKMSERTGRSDPQASQFTVGAGVARSGTRMRLRSRCTIIGACACSPRRKSTKHTSI